MLARTDLRPWRWTTQERRSFLVGMLFISPWLIGFLAFLAYPIAASLYYSFTDYDILSRTANFVGLENYERLLFKDEYIGKVTYNTLYYVVYAVPAGMVTAFLLAVLLNSKLRARSVFRTLFYIPSVVPAVASAMVWLWIFNMQYGVINSFLASIGLQGIPFLSSQTLVKPSLIIIHCWSSGSAMVIFLAALQDVPRSLYDAATVDGAGKLQQFWHVTVPMCTPAILFSLLTGMIGAFQYFTFAWILTQGGPNRASEFYAVHLYRQAFVFLRMGYASAMAWALFAMVVIVTVILYRSSARWVYYGGE
ncbi:MAG: sugar ABC transporter permease [Anaerolineales bacterium]|nr:sugar ABC transporter permease [Anaerolineales bacterium]